MYIIVFLTIGLSALSLQAQAEETVTALKPPSPSMETTTIIKPDPNTTPTNNAIEAPVVIITDQPVSASMQEALAAPNDSYLEGKDLNTDEEPANPDEADEADEEDTEDGEDETIDEEE